MTNEELRVRKDAATPRGISVLAPFFCDHAMNAELWDIEGNRYIDFGAGISVLNTGHRHPKLTAAIRAQLERFTHTAYQIVPYESYVALAERINMLATCTHPAKTAFFTTGAEAVENAVKIARAATGRPGIIALTGAFHGRTFMGMALTGKVAPYKIGFGPFPGPVHHVPMPITLHTASVEQSLSAIEQLFKSDIDPSQVAAFILEPVQGEGGFYVIPPDFMRAVRAVCDKHGILLIADEVQTGFGRTGKMFAMEHYDVKPDLFAMAKSIAGGIPLSGVCGRAAVMDAPLPGGLGGTYGGNPLAIASAHAVLDVIEEEHLCARALELGDRLKSALNKLRPTQPHIAEVRGLGAMVAVEFCRPGTCEPDAAFTAKVQNLALRSGLLLLTCGVHANVIRFLFPLTIQDDIFEEGLATLNEVLVSA